MIRGFILSLIYSNAVNLVLLHLLLSVYCAALILDGLTARVSCQCLALASSVTLFFSFQMWGPFLLKTKNVILNCFTPSSVCTVLSGLAIAVVLYIYYGKNILSSCPVKKRVLSFEFWAAIADDRPRGHGISSVPEAPARLKTGKRIFRNLELFVSWLYDRHKQYRHCKMPMNKMRGKGCNSSKKKRKGGEKFLN